MIWTDETPWPLASTMRPLISTPFSSSIRTSDTPADPTTAEMRPDA